VVQGAIPEGRQGAAGAIPGDAGRIDAPVISCASRTISTGLA